MITETKTKVPEGSSFEISTTMSEGAYNVDPLLKGTIMPYLKNTILGSYHIDTDDDKRFSVAINEIEKFVQDLGLVDCFRDDFPAYAIKHGKSFRRIDYAGNTETVYKLSPLNN